MYKYLKTYWYLCLGLILIVILASFRLLSGEDNWICQNGDWVKHGFPNSPKPSTSCPKPEAPVEKTATETVTSFLDWYLKPDFQYNLSDIQNSPYFTDNYVQNLSKLVVNNTQFDPLACALTKPVSANINSLSLSSTEATVGVIYQYQHQKSSKNVEFKLDRINNFWEIKAINCSPATPSAKPTQ